jgi:hypothetical protein
MAVTPPVGVPTAGLPVPTGAGRASGVAERRGTGVGLSAGTGLWEGDVVGVGDGGSTIGVASGT